LAEAAAARGIRIEIPAHKYSRTPDDQIGLCRAGEETCEIDGDGEVYPCSFSFGRFSAGNVRSNSFDDIFASLQWHSINNEWCFACKGRGGKAEKVYGRPPALIESLELEPLS
jgi:MoaA/NifB/PqqE/SkfB family radical SAM enzyme